MFLYRFYYFTVCAARASIFSSVLCLFSCSSWRGADRSLSNNRGQSVGAAVLAPRLSQDLSPGSPSCQPGLTWPRAHLLPRLQQRCVDSFPSHAASGPRRLSRWLFGCFISKAAVALLRQLTFSCSAQRGVTPAARGMRSCRDTMAPLGDIWAATACRVRL